jgi:gas vesicle protein
MRPMTERDMRAVALGMAVGAAVGAAVALLLAPKRGAELRDDLVRSAANAGRTVAGSARRRWDAALKQAGARRADDSADLQARSGDMVAEGGPDAP